MLPLYNDNWRGSRRRLSSPRFVERLTLTDLNIHAGGRSTVWFSSGDMFSDHAIEVRIDERVNTMSVYLSG